MKIYIACSFDGEEICSLLRNELMKLGYIVSDDFELPDIPPGTSLDKGYTEYYASFDLYIILITKEYLTSITTEGIFSELSRKNKILPVIVDDLEIPDFLKGTVAIKSENSEYLIKDVVSSVKDYNGRHQKSQDEILYENINNIKKAKDNGKLTLVLGAGVSISSGLKKWNELLVNMLYKYIIDKNYVNISAEQLQENLQASPLLLGKYLKLSVANIQNAIKENLYSDYVQTENNEPEIVKSIVDLARIKLNKKPIESVITFNYDSIIEDALKRHEIDNCAIWEAGQQPKRDDIPIYHVHGYLPKDQEIKNPNLVFSEDEYHNQYIEPYKWSNLIQLNKFDHYTCLFVGLSLTDPNLRRLLDFSKKNTKVTKHFAFLQNPGHEDKIANVEKRLIEQDMISLGINVIWFSEFDEIPKILNMIIE